MTERARRSVDPARNGPGAKAGARGKSGSAKGNQAKGNQAKGNQAKGNQAKGGQAKGNQAKGGPAKGGPAKQAPNAKTTTAPAAAGKGRRSTGVVLRRIQPNSVLRVSALFYLGVSLALFIAGVLLWIGANVIGLVGNIEGFMDEIGFTDFRLRPTPLLLASALISVILVTTGSLANYLMAVLYNLIADVVGGIKVVLTEDPDTTGK